MGKRPKTIPTAQGVNRIARDLLIHYLMLLDNFDCVNPELIKRNIKNDWEGLNRLLEYKYPNSFYEIDRQRIVSSAYRVLNFIYDQEKQELNEQG